jgi:dsDNA-specific endonuclease/ATPase MutS2
VNNAIRRLEREAEAEVDRILGDLTRVGAAGDDIGVTAEALADLDLILGQARLAERWRRSPWSIRAAASACEGQASAAGDASPLAPGADEQEVVPIDVPEPSRTCWITGPNAGGRRALKTAGLLVLMGRPAHIPASPDSSPVLVGVCGYRGRAEHRPGFSTSRRTYHGSQPFSPPRTGAAWSSWTKSGLVPIRERGRP